MHLYQKYEKGKSRTLKRISAAVWNPTMLVAAICSICSLLIAVRPLPETQPKDDMPPLIDKRLQARDERPGILPPKTVKEVEESSGKSCEDVGKDVCDKMREAEKALLDGKCAEAETMYDALIELFPDVPGFHFNLAYACGEQYKLEKAAEHYTRATVLDPEDAASYNNLGNVLYNQAKYAEAESLYTRAAESLYTRALAIIDEKALGKDHPVVATVCNNLALLYYAQWEYPQAEALFKRALAIWEDSLGPDHPDVAKSLNNLAWVYEAQGKYAEAEPLYKRALAIVANALGPDDPSLVGILNSQALLYERLGRSADAGPLYQRALEIEEKYLGSDHPSVATSLSYLAYWCKEEKLYARAEPLFMRLLAIHTNTVNPQHPHTLATLDSIVGFYRAWGKEDEARKYEARKNEARKYAARLKKIQDEQRQ